MTNISIFSDKQIENLKGKSDSEISLVAARRAMEEVRRNHHIQEPDQLASGMSDESGNMVIIEEEIYRIHHDENYLMHVIPPVESMNKLGAEHRTFVFNAEPKKYAKVWQPLHIDFSPGTVSKAKAVPRHFGEFWQAISAH
ncbi:MAG: hypothetical protein ACI9FB_004571 [Candidatus Azotimanducaceae bacterium]|jgi:hypothetical protein